MIESIRDYENWRDSQYDRPGPDPEPEMQEHEVRFYSHDYTADTMLEYSRQGERAQLTLAFSSEDLDMGVEEMVYGGESRESMAELVSDLKGEITGYLDAADTASFYEQQGLSTEAAGAWGEYSRTALYAFEAITTSICMPTTRLLSVSMPLRSPGQRRRGRRQENPKPKNMKWSDEICI